MYAIIVELLGKKNDTLLEIDYKMNITDDVQKIRNVDVSKYKSSNLMTKYEFDQVISLRTTHLSRGAVSFVAIQDDFKITTNMDLRKVALMELKEGKIPYLIKRVLPSKEIEYWAIKNLDLSGVRYLMRD